MTDQAVPDEVLQAACSAYEDHDGYALEPYSEEGIRLAILAAYPFLGEHREAAAQERARVLTEVHRYAGEMRTSTLPSSVGEALAAVVDDLAGRIAALPY